jgi:hypothetical protein
MLMRLWEGRRERIWYFYTMEFYLATKKNEILSFAGKWMEPEDIFLSKVSQIQKDKGYMFSLTHLWKIDPIQIQARSYTHISKYRTYFPKWDC